MRRILSLILCLAIVCTAAISFADEPLAPSVKIQRQMQNDGNGVKGNFRIDGNANAEDHPLIAAIQGAEFEVLRNAQEDRWHLITFQKDEQGQQLNKTEMVQETDGLYVRSDFLPERVFRIPAVTDLIPGSLTGAGENPSILNVLMSIASKTGADKTRWDNISEKYIAMLETWLAGYASTPELQRSADGTTKMKLIYIVPAGDIGSEIVNLVRTAAEDPEATALLAPEMTEEQRLIYLNAGLEQYYREVMQSLNLTGEIRFEKEVTTLGEMTAAGISLPLDPAATGYRTLEINSRNGQIGFSLNGDSGMLRVAIPDGLAEITGQTGFEGTGSLIRFSNGEERKDGNLALRFDIRKTFETFTDDETERIHEIHHYTVTVVRDTQNIPEDTTDADFPDFETVSLDADFHFSSKAPQSSPVTVESTIEYSRGETKLSLSGKVKTAATWAFVPFTVENAIPLSGMAPEEAAAALAEWIQNAAGSLQRTE